MLNYSCKTRHDPLHSEWVLDILFMYTQKSSCFSPLFLKKTFTFLFFDVFCTRSNYCLCRKSPPSDGAGPSEDIDIEEQASSASLTTSCMKAQILFFHSLLWVHYVSPHSSHFYAVTIENKCLADFYTLLICKTWVSRKDSTRVLLLQPDPDVDRELIAGF